MAKFKGKYRAESNRWQSWDYSAPGRYFLTNCILDRKCILGYVKNGKMILSEFGKIVKNEILNMPYYHPRVILDEWIVMPNHIHIIIELGDYGFNNGLVAADKSAANNADTTDNADTAANPANPANPADTVDKIHEFYQPSPEFYQPPPPSSPESHQPPPLKIYQPPPWWQDFNYKSTQEEIKQYRKQRRLMIIPKISGKMKMISSKQINIIQKTPGKKNWQNDYYDHVIRNEPSYRRIKQYIINNPKKWDEDKFNQ